MVSKTGYLILGLLTEQPLTGYLIRKITLMRFRFFWSESFGQIYPQLKSLSAAGLIQAEKTATEGRKQTSYSLTAEGKRVLEEWLADTQSQDQLRMESMLKIYMSAVSGSASCRGNIEEFRKKSGAARAAMEEMRQELESIPDPHRNHRKVISMLDLGISTYRVWESWASETDLLKE